MLVGCNVEKIMNGLEYRKFVLLEMVELWIGLSIENLNGLKWWNYDSAWVLKMCVGYNVEIMNRRDYEKFDFVTRVKLSIGLNTDHLISLKDWNY